MRSLRILKVTQVYPPSVSASGQAITVQDISRHLTRRGHRVTVITTAQGRPSPDASSDGVEVVCLSPTLSYRSLAINPREVGFCRRRLRSFDVVHIYGIYDLLGPLVASFCRRSGVPYVLEPMGMFRPIVRSIAFKRAYLRLVGRPVVMGASHVIATAELERDELIAGGVPPEKVIIRRNGVDLPSAHRLPPRGTFRREIGLTGEEPLILYLGRLSRKKGLDLLLDAFSALATSAVLVIVGPDDGDGCAQDIERRRRRFGLNGRVRVLGPRLGAEKWAALADADVFVLPSRSENFGNAAAEAVVCGVPVVVTDRCGIAPLVRDRAGLVVPCGVEAIGTALRRLVEDSGLRARFRAGAVAMRSELSWDEPITQTEQLYAKLVRNRRATAAATA